MSINKVRKALYDAAKLLGDVQAIKKGKIGQRIANRVIGKALNKVTRNLWRK